MSVCEGTHIFTTAGPDMEMLHPIDRLRLAIIHRAVLDWDTLVRGKAWLGEQLYFNQALDKFNFTELRGFFKSDWCEMLMQNSESYKPMTMLEILEQRLDKAMAKESCRCQ